MRQPTINLDPAEVLKRSYLDALEKEKVLRAFRARTVAVGQEASWRTRRCPGCGQGLKLKATSGQTIFVCASCSWTLAVPFEMDEAVRLGESYIPGVTKQRKPTVVLGVDGSIKRIIG